MCQDRCRRMNTQFVSELLAVFYPCGFLAARIFCQHRRVFGNHSPCKYSSAMSLLFLWQSRPLHSPLCKFCRTFRLSACRLGTGRRLAVFSASLPASALPPHPKPAAPGASRPPAHTSPSAARGRPPHSPRGLLLRIFFLHKNAPPQRVGGHKKVISYFLWNGVASVTPFPVSAVLPQE